MHRQDEQKTQMYIGKVNKPEVLTLDVQSGTLHHDSCVAMQRFWFCCQAG